MHKPKNILLRLAELGGNLDEELVRLARLRSQGKLQWQGGETRGNRAKERINIRSKIDAFRSEVMDFTEGQCWNWKGRLFSSGYGIISLRSSRMLAHRFSFAVFKGKHSPLYLCHHCDNPRCVNPEHLFEGTHTDNIRDCINKNRFGDHRGVLNASHKLTDVEVREIRRSPLSLKTLAVRFGVSKSAVHMARNRQTWSHVSK